MTRDNSKTSYRPVVGITLVSLIVCGLFFPLLITGLAQLFFPYQANGQMVRLNGHAVGSVLISQQFTLPVFFHGRNESNPLTASASLVDPDIPLDQALSQIPRISNATGIPADAIRGVVLQHVEGTFWIFGSPYVNVLRLNTALIRAYPSVYNSTSA
ncbi:MAG TPA: potassium-transporting ATPase subunit C [Nitrososphaerales archaeon]|nr:potassium-transporting ATPase subunit C [Nitrososphaerales archaeon]